MAFRNTSQTGVLIVGGGLVGLSAALFLRHHGVPFILVERNIEASPLPRARGIAVRTMELFRQIGLEGAIREAADAAWETGVFGGARHGRTMLGSEALPLPQHGKTMTGDDPSPTAMAACPQTQLEPVLRRALAERGGDVRFGVECVELSEAKDAVVAIIRNEQGVETIVTAAYVLGADGGRSFVRHHLGVGTIGTEPDRHLLNVFFECDLAARVEGRTFSQCEIANDRVSGLFLSMNNTDKWSFHLHYDPAREDPESLSDTALAELLREAIGADVPLAIRHRSPWSTAVRVAERYRRGRVFLAGDAAHLMPPWGGFNANTGIADAHNLAWKLAAMIDGKAQPDLLDTYETERRPLAVRNGEQARLRSDFQARFGIQTSTNKNALAEQMDAGALLMRYRYPLASGADPLRPPDPVEDLHAQTGTRFPHGWISIGGKRRSTLDLFGDTQVLLAGPEVSLGGDPAVSAASARMFVCGCDFVFEEGTDWHTLTGLPECGAVLVRPDGFVAERISDLE